MRSVLSIFCLLSLGGCLSNQIVLDKKFSDPRPPDYVDYMDYWWWGFRGDPNFDLAKICVDQKPLAFEQSKEPTDVLLTVVTLGIYTPSTLQVWCGDRP